MTREEINQKFVGQIDKDLRQCALTLCGFRYPSEVVNDLQNYLMDTFKDDYFSDKDKPF